MEVILLERIRHLGQLGDRVSIKAGYARNYLLPKGKALIATAENIKEFESRRDELEKAQAAVLDTAMESAEKINDMQITLVRMTGEEGKLFGSVSAYDIAKSVTEAGVELTKKQVFLPEGPLRQLGEFDIPIGLSHGVEAVLKVFVVAEEK